MNFQVIASSSNFVHTKLCYYVYEEIKNDHNFISLCTTWCYFELCDHCDPRNLILGKRRRITLIECNNDINSMIDIAKIADLVFLMIDGSFGFEMEIFEFLNISQVSTFFHSSNSLIIYSFDRSLWYLQRNLFFLIFLIYLRRFMECRK